MKVCNHCNNEMSEVVTEDSVVYHGYAGKVATMTHRCLVCGATAHEFIPILTKIHIATSKLTSLLKGQPRT